MVQYTLTDNQYIELWNSFVYSRYSGPFEFYIEERYNGILIDRLVIEFKSEKDLTIFLLTIDH